MKARYRYRFYPTTEQKNILAQLFGCTRVVWNDALAQCKSVGKALNYNKLSRQLTQAKKTDERKWLTDVSSVPLQQSLKHLSQAYKNFFDFAVGKRKGKQIRPPRFKKRNNKQRQSSPKQPSVKGTTSSLS